MPLPTRQLSSLLLLELFLSPVAVSGDFHICFHPLSGQSPLKKIQSAGFDCVSVLKETDTAVYAAQAKKLGLSIQKSSQEEATVNIPALEREIGRFPHFYIIRLLMYQAILDKSKQIVVYPSDDIFDYEEKWYSIEKAADELAKFKPIVEKGKEITVPFELSGGLIAKAWKYRFKSYVVILNPTKYDLPMPGELSRNSKWRVLFEHNRSVLDFVKDRENPVIESYSVFVLEGDNSVVRQ